MMTPTGIPLSVLLLVSILGAAVWADSPKIVSVIPAEAAPAASPASAKPGDAARQRFKRPGSLKRPTPLKRLVFSAKEGFSLRMVSNQDVTAEIRNGAGRTLARTSYTLEAGDWTLRPRNLPPGLYTVLLRTGPQLRSMRMKIEGSERGDGSPEWVLEKAKNSTNVIDPSAQQGAFIHPVPD
ncbi:MAG: hypothetical protein M3Y08_08745 [Fibrobacterota bacterium]|nr:hypothetical protein [Fibrobacterota bacterium]